MISTFYTDQYNATDSRCQNQINQGYLEVTTFAHAFVGAFEYAQVLRCLEPYGPLAVAEIFDAEQDLCDNLL